MVKPTMAFTIWSIYSFDKYEGTVSADSFDNLPKEYIDHMVKAIVGFTIEVEQLDNVFKLSQNRDEASQRNIIDQLRKRGDSNSTGIADEMEKLNTKTN